MKIFSPLYDRIKEWARHRHAERYLAGMTFAEASFFPVPPDVMLAPMVLVEPVRWKRYALVTTMASVFGGLAGYALGYFAFEWIEPWLQRVGYAEKYEHVSAWFDEWGVWLMFIAGFTPIPFKLFTIAAGVAQMALLPFFIASTIGRGCRFFLVSGLVAWGGKRVEAALLPYIDYFGWLLIGAAMLFLIFR